MEYITCENGVSQYEDYDLYTTNIVDAVYIHAKTPIDKGNPYIEALPAPRDDESIMNAYTRDLVSYRYDKVKSSRCAYSLQPLLPGLRCS